LPPSPFPLPPSPSSYEPSFRDPDSGVHLQEGRVFRFFTGRGVAAFESLRRSGLLDSLVRQGLVLPYEMVSDEALTEPVPADAVVIEQPVLPFVSYPYEWPFGMLQAAAQLHLDLIETALQAGFSLKDASAYNIQFLGTRPVFIDLGSFAPYQEGQPWYAYTQFCQMFLNPLLLYALTGTPYHWWLRSAIEGIPPGRLSPLLGLRHKLRRAVFVHVVLQGQLQRRLASLGTRLAGQRPQVARQAVLRNIAALRRAIGSLTPPSGPSAWSGYDDSQSYSSPAREQKAAFVAQVVQQLTPSTIWDLGCNQGDYTELASRHARSVVAMDGDPQAVDLLYRRLKGREQVLPLVMDLLNPSPDQGWAERERLGLAARGKADFVLCLALLHHLRIGGNVPLAAIIRWLAQVARAGILEFVPRSDPMARRLMGWREDIWADYTQASLETELARYFRIERTLPLGGSARVLYHLGPP